MPKQTGIKTFFQPKSLDTSDFSQNENPKQDHSAKKTDSSINDQLCDDKFENIKNSKLKIEIDSNECSDFENNEIENDQPRNKKMKFDEHENGTVLGEKYHPPKNFKWIKR